MVKKTYKNPNPQVCKTNPNNQTLKVLKTLRV
jgi:hypothetical protein